MHVVICREFALYKLELPGSRILIIWDQASRFRVYVEAHRSHDVRFTVLRKESSWEDVWWESSLLYEGISFLRRLGSPA